MCAIHGNAIASLPTLLYTPGVGGCAYTGDGESRGRKKGEMSSHESSDVLDGHISPELSVLAFCDVTGPSCFQTQTGRFMASVSWHGAPQTPGAAGSSGPMCGCRCSGRAPCPPSLLWAHHNRSALWALSSSGVAERGAAQILACARPANSC